MGAITGTYGLVKYQSLSLLLTMDAASSTVSNTDLLTTSGLVTAGAGALKTFLSTSFATDAAAETAFRALGGLFEIRQTAGAVATQVSAAWTAATSTPSLTLAGGAAAVALEVRIRIPHTIVQ